MELRQSISRLSRWSLHIDWPLFIGIFSVILIGLFILYSASYDFEQLQRQLLRIGLATGLMLLMAQVPPRILRSFAPWVYFIGLSLLIVILVFGAIAKGGQRWLDLWLIRFQPAELMKIAVPLMVARWLDEEILPPKYHTLIIPAILVILPFLLVAKQPDLGTAILILSTGFFVIFFAGFPWKVMIIQAGLCVSALPLFWVFLREYQRERILTFLNPDRDPLGSGYHIIQSKIAIGSGGLGGKGWLNGTQSQLEFLPERATDSIFAVFSEEFGLVGCLVLLSIYIYIIIRGLYIGVQAQDTFCRLLSGSLTMAFFVYIFVNIGMVTGILPVVGIPLPLISYGGTSLVTLMASFGILMSIHTHRTLLAK